MCFGSVNLSFSSDFAVVVVVASDSGIEGWVEVLETRDWLMLVPPEGFDAAVMMGRGCSSCSSRGRCGNGCRC